VLIYKRPLRPVSTTRVDGPS